MREKNLKRLQFNSRNKYHAGIRAGTLALFLIPALISSPAFADPTKPDLDRPISAKAPKDRLAPPPPVEPELTSGRYARPLPVELVEEPLAVEPTSVKLKAKTISGPSRGSGSKDSGGAPISGGASGGTSGGAADGAGAAAGEEGDDELSDVSSGSDLPDEGVTTLLNVKDAEITSLVKTFSKLTKRNYIVDSNVKGKITIHLPTAVTMGEALRILDSVLLLKGFTTVPVGKNTWKVVTAKDAQQTTIPLMMSDEEHPTDALVTKLVRMRHVQASDIQAAISSFVSKEGAINAFNGTNSLILIDSAANIERLEKLVTQLDIPTLDQDLTIIPVLHAEAKDIAEKINDILGEDSENGGGDAAKRTGQQAPAVAPIRPAIQPGQPGRTGANQVTAGTERRALPLKVIPDDRTNSIIVVADVEMTTRVKALVEQLDSPVDQSSGRFYVYRLKHAEASELAEILSALVGGGGGSSSSKSKKETSSQSSLSGSSNSRSPFFNSGSSMNNSQNSRSQLRNGTGLTGTDNTTRNTGNKEGGGKVYFEGEISIAAEDSTNSLIISASKTDYLRVKELIDQLDLKRRQVLVEATILEVSLDRIEGMGVELQGTGANDNAAIMGQTSFGGLTNILSNPAALADLTIAAASTGTLTLPGGIVIPSQALLITAVSKNQDVNVLSTPTILATDNEEAQIIVGENVPFVTSTSTDPSNLNNTFNSIERQDVGIKLHLTPQISGEGDFVGLKLMVEISNVVPGTQNDKNGPTTTIRTTETSVEVKNEQMIVTGGLISDTVTKATRGVPYWEDIPVLGNLFKREDETRRRTNLLVFLTPRIIKDQFDARETTKTSANQVGKLIDDQQVQPDRSEILRSDSIDKVTDEVDPGPVKPTSIIPPNIPVPQNPEAASAIERTQERMHALLKGDSAEGPKGGAEDPEGGPPAGKNRAKIKEEQIGDEAVIDVKVRPKLPNGPAEKVLPSPARIKSEPAAKAIGGDSPSAAAGTYVVLRASDGASTAPGVVFSDRIGTAGVAIVGDLGSSSGQFFSVGRRYVNKASGKEFVCIGVFGSPNEAAIIHSELGAAGAWNRLTPAASIRLGKDGWIAR